MDGKWVFTSPWRSKPIPEPVLGPVHVVRQWTGHFGKQDPICWPQVFVDDPRFRWYCAVTREPHTDPRTTSPKPADPSEGIVWTPLTSKDVVPYSRAGIFAIVGQKFRDDLSACVRRQKERAEAFLQQNGQVALLKRLLWGMVDAQQRLTLPSTEPDLIRQVACAQRFYLLVGAWLEWHTHLFDDYRFRDPHPPTRRLDEAEGVRNDLMGTFTTSVEVAQQLFRQNIPVWFMREPDRFTSDDTVVNIVNGTVRSSALDHNPGVFPTTVLASEWAGPRHFSAIMSFATQALDFEKTPRPADISSDRIYEKQRQAQLAAEKEKQDVKIPNSRKTQKTHDHVVAASGSRTVTDHRYHPCKFAVHTSVLYLSVPALDWKPTAGASQQSVSGQRMKRHPKDIREKFEDRLSTFMPPCNPAWQNALRSVDRTRDAPSQDYCWDFWVPEAAMLANAGNTDRSHRFAWAWLSARPAWFWILDNDCLRHRGMKPPSITDWKHYLNFGLHPEDAEQGDTVTAKKKRVVMEYFTDILSGQPLLTPEEISWRLQPFTGSEQQMREILWELCDLGFRLELQELDTALIPAPADPVDRGEFEKERDQVLQQVFGTRPLLSRLENFTAEGFSASLVGDRIASLEGLRQVMLRWPNVPEGIRSCAPLVATSTPTALLVRVEAEICRHYCQTFWEWAGRAATIPRLWPLSVVEPELEDVSRET